MATLPMATLPMATLPSTFPSTLPEKTLKVRRGESQPRCRERKRSKDSRIEQSRRT